jgi:hypothetical protein
MFPSLIINKWLSNIFILVSSNTQIKNQRYLQLCNLHIYNKLSIPFFTTEIRTTIICWKVGLGTSPPDQICSYV